MTKLNNIFKLVIRVYFVYLGLITGYPNSKANRQILIINQKKQATVKSVAYVLVKLICHQSPRAAPGSKQDSEVKVKREVITKGGAKILNDVLRRSSASFK